MPNHRTPAHWPYRVQYRPRYTAVILYMDMGVCMRMSRSLHLRRALDTLAVAVKVRH